MMVAPNQFLINVFDPSSHNTVDGGVDEEEVVGVMMRRWMQNQATTLSLKMLRISGITKKWCIVINGIDFDKERPLLKRNSSIISMTKAVTMGNIILIR